MLTLTCFQKLVLSNDFTFYDNTIEGIRNYSSLMIGDKVFGGIETNDWKGVSGIVLPRNNTQS